MTESIRMNARWGIRRIALVMFLVVGIAAIGLLLSPRDAAGVDDDPGPGDPGPITQPPETVIDSGPVPPGGVTNDNTPTFSFHSEPSGATFECAGIEAPPSEYKPCESPYSPFALGGSLPDGDYTLSVRATLMGSVNGVDVPFTDQTPATYEFTVDTSGPIVTIDSGPEEGTTQRRPQFTFSSGEAVAGFQCSLDQGTPDFGPCSGPGQAHRPASDLALGTPYTFRVRATDTVGNTGIPATRSFVVCTILGTAGDDELTGTAANDVICGLGGNDTLTSLAGEDTVYGGGGNDTIDSGSQADDAFGGEGADTLVGRSGLNTLDGGPGDDALHGGSDDDHILGGEDNDMVFGEFGADLVEGGEGDDRLTGGDGGDDLRGDGGDDHLYGLTGNDALDGGVGYDFCKGGTGTNTEVNCETNLETCDICVDFVTTYDPDRDGPVPERTKLHHNLSANIPYSLDVDGGLDPLPLGLPLPGYDVQVVVQGVDPDKPTIRITKLALGLPVMPLRIEVVKGAPVKQSFGYDSLETTAPQSFVAKLDTSDRDADVNTEQVAAEISIGGASQRLTILNETFRGDPIGTRTERSIRRAEFVGGAGGTQVPGNLTLDLTTSEASTHAILTHDSRTVLNFELLDPTGTRTAGTLDELPQFVDLTLSEEDLNADGEADTKIAYAANAVADLDFILEQPLEGGIKRTTASVDGLPTSVDHLTFAEAKQDGKSIGGDVTYSANAQAGPTEVVIEDTKEKTIFDASLSALPAEIEKLRWRTPDNHANVEYVASGPTPQASVTMTDQDLPAEDPFPAGDWREITANVTNVPQAFEIDVTLENETLEDGTEEQRGVVYKASSGDVDVEVTGESNRPFAEGRIKEESPDDVALRREAGANNLRLTLTDLPESVCALFPSADDIAVTAGASGLASDGSDELGSCDDGADRVEGSVGQVEFQLTSEPGAASAESLQPGLNGLLLRDGRILVSGDGDGVGLDVPPVPASGPDPRVPMFVAFVRANGLREFSIESLEEPCADDAPSGCEPTDLGFDLRIGSGGDNRTVLDWVQSKGEEFVWTGPINREATDVITAVVPDPPSVAEVNYRPFPGDLDSPATPATLENGIQFHYGSNEVSDPASGENALTFEQRTLYDGANVPVTYETQPATDHFQSSYLAREFSSLKQATLDILPAGLAPNEALHVCRAEGKVQGNNNVCTEDVFTEDDFAEDFGPEDADQGSLRFQASSPTALSYLDQSVGAEGFTYSPWGLGGDFDDLNEEDFEGCTFDFFDLDELIACEDTKPGMAISALDQLRATDFSLQFHSTEEDCCGFVGGWLGGYSEKGYLAMDSGWEADCVDEDGEPIIVEPDEPDVCSDEFNVAGFTFHGPHFHNAPPVDQRASGVIELKPNLELPSDDPSAWDFSENSGTETLRPLGQAGAIKLSPFFGADHRIMEADPGDAGLLNVIGGITGWDSLKESDITSGTGHVYCARGHSDPALRTQFTGALEEIGGFYCTKFTGGEIPPE